MTVAYDTQLGYACSSVCPRSHLSSVKTAEHLTLASLGKSVREGASPASEAGDRSNSQFKEDQSIPALFRAKLQDYFRSGYDRGHM